MLQTEACYDDSSLRSFAWLMLAQYAWQPGLIAASQKLLRPRCKGREAAGQH